MSAVQEFSQPQFFIIILLSFKILIIIVAHSLLLFPSSLALSISLGT